MRSLTLALACAVLACALRADEGGKSAAPVLRGPEVLKLDWNTRSLMAQDLDADGRIDLALINNDRASIELLYQIDPAAPADTAKARKARQSARANRWEPELEDARFRRETLIVGQNLYDLVAADFNGDGRVDLAATGDPSPLLVRYAQADGTWEEKPFATAPNPVRFVGGLIARDLDGDGRSDLVVLGQKEIAVFLQKPDIGLVLDEKIPLGDDNAYGLLVTDIDGDGLPDLAYLVPGGRESLRVRRQVAPGKFGPELSFALRTPRSPLVPLRASAAEVADGTERRATRSGSAGKKRAGQPRPSAPTGLARAPGGTDLLLASALGASGQVEFTRLSTARDDDRWRGLAPRAFSPLAGARGPAFYAIGDFNRDGASDLAVAFGETAQVFVYLRQSDGGFTVPRRVASLTDAKALGALSWQADETADRLFVLSGKENALAEISFADDGAANPPRALPVAGRLISFAAGPLRQTEGKPSVPGLAVVAEEDGKRTLSLWTRDGAEGLSRSTALTLANLRTDPRSVTLADINQDGLADVLLAVPSAGVRVYLQKDDGSLVDAADNPVYRPGLLARPEAANAPLAFGDVDGDGKAELLVGAENFLRALRIDETGALTIAAQFDARDSGSEVTTGFVLAAEQAGGAPRVILHDRRSDQLHLLERLEGASATETTEVRGVARLDVTGAFQLTGPKGRRELVLAGRDRFWWMPEGGADFALKSEGSYASDLPDVRYFYLTPGDFSGDGRDDLVAVDIRNNTLEILGRDDAGVWGSLLHFRVFETDPHYEGDRGGGQEPRECVVADVTGDGKADLVLLIHDRILVYPQE